MDALAALLDGPRAHRAFVLRSVLDPPWALRVEDGAALSLVAVLRGRAWIRGLTPDPVEVPAGSIVLLRGPEPYEVGSDENTSVQVVIGPGQSCTAVGSASLAWRDGIGVRTWGNSDGDAGVGFEVTGSETTVLLTGTYDQVGELGRGLLVALPPLVSVPTDPASEALVALLAQEAARDQPGQEAVLDRLLDLLVVTTVRTWWESASGAPGWYSAWSDPSVGRVLQLMQHEPGRPWTLASLAAEAHISRAGLARRFTRLVGRSPMAFLTDWRLDLAADLLATSDATLEQIARRVGYADGFSLSTAFRRVRGISPHVPPRGWLIRSARLRRIPRSRAAAPTSAWRQ